MRNLGDLVDNDTLGSRSHPERELSYEERAVWGTCPVCQADPGQECDPDQGVPLGWTASGGITDGRAHLGRLRLAPRKVKLIPIG